MAASEECGALLQFRKLLDIRKRKIVPLLKENPHWEGEFQLIGDSGIAAQWSTKHGSRLRLLANLGHGTLDNDIRPGGEILYSTGDFPGAWSVIWSLDE